MTAQKWCGQQGSHARHMWAERSGDQPNSLECPGAPMPDSLRQRIEELCDKAEASKQAPMNRWVSVDSLRAALAAVPASEPVADRDTLADLIESLWDEWSDEAYASAPSFGEFAAGSILAAVAQDKAEHRR